jgi:biopolymer transport protein ExbB/TolQ
MPMPLLFQIGPLPLAAGGVVYAIEQSGLAGKAIVCLLMMASVFSWSIMWTKYKYIRECQNQNRRFIRCFRKAVSPLDPLISQRSFLPSSLYIVYLAGARELHFHLTGTTRIDEPLQDCFKEKKVGATSMASVRSAMEQAVGEEALKLESQLILLASAVSGAPFLGLLGTVWGVMDAFSGIALAGRPDIAALAPGVSGALVTTVVGLLVAIPAMFGYNFLINTIRGLTVEMENFSAECASDFEHAHLSTRE